MHIQENISLKTFNTFGLEAKARYFAKFDSEESLITFIRGKEYHKEKKIILNGGSNVLFTQDFDGLVLKINTSGIQIINQDDEHVWISVQAGENWDDFVKYCIERDYGGLENLSMIPGNAGAAPIQNIGAYGVEQKDHFHSLRAINLESGEIKNFIAQECQFGYRSSIFKTSIKGQYLILSVVYKLPKKPNFKIEYGAIKTELKRMGSKTLTPKAVAKAVCTIRENKLPDPEKMGNAGSFFKNPVVDQDMYLRLKDAHPKIAAYPQEGKQYKIAAGWLIESQGWRGKRRGDAGVCETQALVLVNYGNATGQEILTLAREIQESVMRTFGILLEPEVNIY